MQTTNTSHSLIPDGWELKTFEEVMGGFSSGATPYRGNKHFYDGHIKWVTSGELNYNIIIDTIEHISLNAVKITNLKILPEGTFLMAITGLEAAGTRGSCAILGTDATTNQSCMALFPFESKLSTQYLFYYYTLHGDNLALEYCQGTKQQSYTGKIVRKLPILLPPPAEQQAIADALGAVDALLTNQRALLAKKRGLKQAAQQALLSGEQRLPGFAGQWDMKTLGELTEIISGGTPSTANKSYWNGGIKWCTPTDITACHSKYIFTTEKQISHEGLLASSASVLPKGTLLLCSRATVGDIRIAGCTMSTNQGFKSLICKSEADNEFLYYCLLENKHKLIERAYGSTFLEISKKDTAIVELSIPHIDEQRAIATVLSDMDAELEALAAEIEKTQALKQGMMQDLLTGTIRLAPTEATIATT